MGPSRPLQAFLDGKRELEQSLVYRARTCRCVFRVNHIYFFVGPHREPTRSSIKLASSLAIIDGMWACMVDAFVFGLDRTAAASVVP